LSILSAGVFKMILNNKEKDIQNLYKSQKVALYWLLGIIYTAFIGLQLGRIQAIADFNYNLHEIMYAPFTIALFVVPVVFLVYIYQLIKYIRKRGKQSPNFKRVLKAMLVITSIVVIVSITSYQFKEVTTSGVFEVENKLQEDRKYFLVLNNIKVRVSNNEYHLVEENETYLITFVWNQKTPNKGMLQTIEPLK
jgi:heme/copper-type cytochrome/quinol oxidase subunit 2